MRKPLYEQGVWAARSRMIHYNPQLDISFEELAEGIRAYLEYHEERDKARVDGRISPLTRRYAELKVGQFVDVEPMALQIIRQRFKMARRLMNNENAHWQTKTLRNGKIRVTRIADGAEYRRDPWDNEKAVEIAQLKPGESKIGVSIKTVRGEGQMGSNTKIAARRLLNNPDADWTVRSTNQGVRITRIR